MTEEMIKFIGPDEEEETTGEEVTPVEGDAEAEPEAEPEATPEEDEEAEEE